MTINKHVIKKDFHSFPVPGGKSTEPQRISEILNPYTLNEILDYNDPTRRLEAARIDVVDEVAAAADQHSLAYRDNESEPSPEEVIKRHRAIAELYAALRARQDDIESQYETR